MNFHINMIIPFYLIWGNELPLKKCKELGTLDF